MIVCSCNVITMAEIRRAIAKLHADPEPKVVTPGVVYRTLGYRPQCGCCLSIVARAIDESLGGGCCRMNSAVQS